MEAHNPAVTRANDGTYLLFSIGNNPLVQSKSLFGPWRKVNGFKNRTFNCNNPAPVVVPGRDEVYVYCHGLPVGRPLGLAWTPRWDSGVWHVATNNSDDLIGNGSSLIAHSIEDPFAWYAAPPRPPESASNNCSNLSIAESAAAHAEATGGSFHMLFHAFQMGMVNNSGATLGGQGTSATSSVKGQALRRVGNAYGAYANALTPFGPWKFQEARVAYSGVLNLTNNIQLGLLRRERPHLLLDSATGQPTHLYNGVCPDGNHYGEMGTQKNHCFTMVQSIGMGTSLQHSGQPLAPT